MTLVGYGQRQVGQCASASSRQSAEITAISRHHGNQRKSCAISKADTSIVQSAKQTSYQSASSIASASRNQQSTAKADMGSTGEIGSPSAKWRFQSSRPTENAALWWAQHTCARQYRRPTSRLVAMQSLIVAAAKLMAVYRPRLSTRHYQQDAAGCGVLAFLRTALVVVR